MVVLERKYKFNNAFLKSKKILQKHKNHYFINSFTNLETINSVKGYTKFEYFQKRVIDFFLSITLLILAFPIMIYSAYRIKKESPDGDIFFIQNRIGINGKTFKCIKFRSMRTDIDYFNKYTQEDDPRIFPWGKIMRKTRIDELPQLFNVLKGDMHFIGPRAEWDILVKEYEEKITNYNLRHKVKPGITGLAQVEYHYGASLEDTKQKLIYDLYYIDNWSLWLEIKTFLKTILVVLGKKGQ